MTRDLGVDESGHQPGTPENPLHKIATLPNLITLARLVLTIMFLFLYPIDRYRTFAIVIFIIAASTDWLDGQTARRMKQVSVFGKRFDPIMDRVLIFSGVLALYITGRIPTFVVVFLVLRDVYLLFGGIILKMITGSIIDVAYIGKAATFILMTGFAIDLLGWFPVGGLGLIESSQLPGWGSAATNLGIWCIYVGCVLSFVTACVYTARAIRAIKASRHAS